MSVFSERRMTLAQRYASELFGVPNLALLSFDYDNIVPHIFPVRILGGLRTKVVETLAEMGVETGVHYQPNHMLTLFSCDYSLPVTELLGDELLSLPLHPDLTDNDQTYVIEVISDFLTEK